MHEIVIKSIEIRKISNGDPIYDEFKIVKDFWSGKKYESEFLLLAIIINEQYIIGYLWAWHPLWNRALATMWTSNLELISSGKKWRDHVKAFRRRCDRIL